MRNLNPLRPTRRTRRINHIRQIVRRNPRHRSILRPLSQPRPHRLNIQHTPPTIRHQTNQRPPRQQHPQPSIRNHVLQTLTRIRGIKRNIRTTSLQHSQQTNHHLHRPRNTHPNQRLRTHTPRPQQMSQPIRQPIQRGITQLSIPTHQRHPIRKTPSLRLEQLVETRRLQRVLRADAVPLVKNQRTLGSRQHRQVLNWLPGLCHRRFQQHLEVIGHPSDRVFLEEIRAVFETQPEPSGIFLDHEREIEACDPQAHALFDQSVHPRRWSYSVRYMLQQRNALICDHDLEDRVVPQIALWPQCLDDPIEGNLLVALGVEQLFTDLEQHIREAGVATQVHAERHRVDQEPDHGFQFNAMAIGDRHADDHQFLPAVAGQEHRGGG